MMVDSEARNLAEVGSVAADWRSVKIRDVTTQITVGFVGSMSHLFRSAGIVVLRGSNVKEGTLDLSDLRFIDAPTHTLWKKSALLAGDILVVRVGYPGTACVVPVGIGQANAAGLVLIRPDRAIVVPEYLVACLNSDDGRRQVQSLLVGGAQQVFNTATAAEFKLSLPPLREQEAIAEALSDADSAIEALDALIAKKRDVKRAAIQQLLTGRTRLTSFIADWPEVRLGEHVSFLKGSGLAKSDLIEGGPERCIHYGELFTHYGPVIEQVTSRCAPVAAGCRSVRGDVLMPGSDVTPRGLATASAVMVDGVVLGGDVIVIRPAGPTLFGPYLANVIRFNKGSVLRLVKGSTVYHIHAKDLSGLTIQLPPLKEQQAIAEVLSDMDAELEALVAERDKMRLVKQGMMQELLSGRVRLV